jgi:uncharacterized protein YjeT (DUF2065 family)
VSEFVLYIFTALSLVLVIEGLIYALFPDSVKKMMAIAITMPAGQLRTFGTVMALSGFLTVWFLKGFVG